MAAQTIYGHALLSASTVLCPSVFPSRGYSGIHHDLVLGISVSLLPHHYFHNRHGHWATIFRVHLSPDCSLRCIVILIEVSLCGGASRGETSLRTILEIKKSLSCPVPDVSIYYMSNINELPDGILFHWFCKCTPPWMFLPLDIPSEYRPEHVTFGLLCVIFKFPSRIFCRRVPGFATDCPCGVWCRGLTTCLLYVGPPLEF